jgi:hypothetical protein
MLYLHRFRGDNAIYYRMILMGNLLWEKNPDGRLGLI